MEEEDLCWVFGYGSLVWRPAFQYERKVNGFIKGWVRRFWQGSTDHRGVPGAPGRVVTLVRSTTEERTWGVAYAVKKSKLEETLNYLDYREKGGYRRELVTVYYKEETGEHSLNALIYIATEGNNNWLGEAPVLDIARTIAVSEGPSGKNSEYLFQLAAALRAMQVEDHHIFELEKLVLELLNPKGRLLQA